MNIGSNKLFWLCMLPLLVAACCSYGNDDNAFVINRACEINGLHAPWDGLDDSTGVRFFIDDEFLYFLYDVQDETVTVVSDFNNESDVEPEDRVEVFFSPESDMRLYYCAEIDPHGRVLDYSCRYKANMDYSWNFSSLKTFGMLSDHGYSVAGKLSLKELSDLGVNLYEGFHMGVFRADFHADGSVNWYSYVKTEDEKPFFHKPDMLFYAKLK